MSDYYQYEFISAQPLFARIEMELSSYFESNMLSNTLFPIWTKYILDRLGKGSFPIVPAILVIENFEARLPPSFISVREARMCVESGGQKYNIPSYFYKAETYKLNFDSSIAPDRCAPCDPCDICEKRIVVTYKTQGTVMLPSYNTMHLLQPGNINCYTKCSTDSPNMHSKSKDTFDIHGNKFTTNFQSGIVYLTYYSKEYDEEGTNVIPDNAILIDAIEAYIKFKMFEMLLNQITDETYNQINNKYNDYRQMYYERMAAADAQTKKKTIYQKVQDIRKEQHRHDKYIIK